MRSVTSYFNGTLFKKNMTRFWPLWVLYTICWTFLMPVNLMLHVSGYRLDRASEATYFANRTVLETATSPALMLAVIFGVCAAVSVFSYLYNSRSACMIHTLPVRREGLFLTNFVSGYMFFLLPHTGIFLVTLAAEAVAGSVNLGALCMWFLVVNLVTFFFFSFAVLCAMLTGLTLALPAFYGILNGLVLGLEYLISSVLSRFVYGYASVQGLGEFAMWCTPVAKLAENVYVRANNALAGSWKADSFSLIGLQYVLFYALVGLGMLVIALLLYRKRHLESAGDMVSMRVLRPVFRYGVAFCCALTFGLMLYEMFSGTVPEGAWTLLSFMLLCGAAGYFIAEMFLQKSVRVLKTWKGCVAFLLVLSAGIAFMELDVSGFERRVPKPEDIAAVDVVGVGSLPYDYAGHLQGWTETDPEGIAMVTQIHRALVEKKDPRGAVAYGQTADCYLTLYYTLKNGVRVTRSYNGIYLAAANLSDPNSLESKLDRYINSPRVVAGAYELELLKPGQIRGIYMQAFAPETGEVRLNEVAGEENRQRLWDAVKRDFAEGNLGRRYLFADEAYNAEVLYNGLEIEVLLPEDNDTETRGYTRIYTKTISLQKTAKHTLAALGDLGVLKEGEILISIGDYTESYSGNYDKENPFPYAEKAYPIPVR